MLRPLRIDPLQESRLCTYLARATAGVAALMLTVVVGSPVCMGQELDEGSLEKFNFRAIGPTATGGRIVDIAVDPRSDHTIYAASASGGLWKTLNNGTTWNCIFEKEGTISLGDIAIDPNNPDTIWVGTGEANNQRSSYWGDGVYKSTDGGESWKHMGLTDTHHIGRIVVDPSDSRVVYVAAAGHLYTSNEERGLFKTSNGGRTWEKVLYISPTVGVIDVVIDPLRPSIVYAAAYERLRRPWDFDGNGPGSAIYRSEDSGKTWERAEGGLPSGDIGRIGLAVYPKDPRIVYATVSNQNRPATPAKKPQAVVTEDGTVKLPFGLEVKFEEAGCVIVDVDNGSAASRAGVRDGNTLSAVGGSEVTDQEMLVEAVNRLKPNDVLDIDVLKESQTISFQYFVPQDRSGNQIGGEVYRSDDAGITWKKVNERPVGGNPGYYYGQIRVDPNDAQQLYMLGVPMYRSSDGGKTWSGDGAPSVHVDHHALWINPKNSNHLLLGNDGGFHITYDKCATWDHVYNLPLAQFYAIGVDMQYPYHVYGGTQDNGSWGGPSAPRGFGSVGRFDWYRVGGGDGFYVQVDPRDSNTVIAESQFGVIQRLDRTTGNSRSVRPPQSDPEGARDRYNWNSPILMSVHDPRVIYFGGNKLFKSFNQGDDWLVISPDLTTADADRLKGNVPHCTITTISESAINRNVLMVGTDDGKVHLTKDGGENWTDMSGRFPLQPEGWWCSRVQLSSHDDQTAYVSFTGYREDDFRPFVFKTTDGGENWTSIASNLPMEPVNVIKEDPVNANVLYLGTEFGVWVSVNQGSKWLQIDSGLPRVAVHDLLIHPRDMDLVIGTHARGAFIMDDITPLQEVDDEMMSRPVYLFKVRPAIMYSTRTSSSSISGNRRWLAESPPRGLQISYHLQESPDEDLKLEVFNEDNERVAELEPTNNVGINRVQWSFSGNRGGRGGRGGGRRSTPQIVPGTYWAVLTVGDKEYETKIELKSDPNATR